MLSQAALPSWDGDGQSCQLRFSVRVEQRDFGRLQRQHPRRLRRRPSSPTGGSYTTAQTVTISNIPSGDICYYNTDSNCSPAEDRILYTGPFTLSQSETVNAANCSPTAGWSAVTRANFVISSSSSSSSLTITPNGGNFATAQTVTITGAPSGDTCYYTTDGSDPRSSNSTAILYTGPFTVSQSETVQAAFHDPANGWSSVTSAEFNISGS